MQKAYQAHPNYRPDDRSKLATYLGPHSVAQHRSKPDRTNINATILIIISVQKLKIKLRGETPMRTTAYRERG